MHGTGHAGTVVSSVRYLRRGGKVWYHGRMTTTPQQTAPTYEPTPEQLRWPIGTWCGLAGRKGTFKVTGYGRDGSVGVYGGTAGHGMHRSAMPSKLTKRKAP